jgi:hypothetical protein
MGGTPEGELRQASPEKKREPQAAADTEILPTEPQIGNRLADETGATTFSICASVMSFTGRLRLTRRAGSTSVVS